MNLFAGGSDSFYHSRVTTTSSSTTRTSVLDPLAQLPVRGRQPAGTAVRLDERDPRDRVRPGVRERAQRPRLDRAWRVVPRLQAPLWAALGVLPGLPRSGRRSARGGWASSRRSSIRLVVASIDSSTFGYANYLSFYTFFILVALYAVPPDGQAPPGAGGGSRTTATPGSSTRPSGQFLRTERTAVKWAVFTGVAFGTVDARLARVLVPGRRNRRSSSSIQMIIERIRRSIRSASTTLTCIVGLIGFPMAVPYYYFQGPRQGLVRPAGARLLRGAPRPRCRSCSSATPRGSSRSPPSSDGRDRVGALFVLDPPDFTAIVTGQGYFVKTLIYSTVAEAQAPSIDSLILGYGVVTFFLAFVGLALYALAYGPRPIPPRPGDVHRLRDPLDLPPDLRRQILLHRFGRVRAPPRRGDRPGARCRRVTRRFGETSLRSPTAEASSRRSGGRSRAATSS